MKSINVLALDGGGMRGLYTASVLKTLAHRFSQSGGNGLDLGSGFDLIAGTSTGAILACGLAAGIDISEIQRLYCERGKEIFADPMPHYRREDSFKRRLNFWWWCLRHLGRPGSDGRALKSSLHDIFGNETLGEQFERRGIGLCVSATSLHGHHPWIFKTPHISAEHHRDNNVKIIDACLGSAAAPVYLPLAASNGGAGEVHHFADGGLWANNPVLIGLIEALAVARNREPIKILSIGTCPPPAGNLPNGLQRGLGEWKMGAAALELSMNAQARAAHFQAEHLVKHLNRLEGIEVSLCRLPETSPSAEMAKSIGLDRADDNAIGALMRHGADDGNEAYRLVQSETEEGKLLKEIFGRMRPNPQVNHQK